MGTLSQMFPMFARDDQSDRARMNTIALSQVGEGVSPSGMSYSNHANFFISQFVHSVSCASWVSFRMLATAIQVSSCRAALCLCVSVVVTTRAEEQVQRIYAQPNIATMTDAHSRWDSPTPKFKRDSMGQLSTERAIAGRGRFNASLPNPTPIRLDFHQRQESLTADLSGGSIATFHGTETFGFVRATFTAPFAVARDCSHPADAGTKVPTAQFFWLSTKIAISNASFHRAILPSIAMDGRKW